VDEHGGGQLGVVDLDTADVAGGDEVAPGCVDAGVVGKEGHGALNSADELRCFGCERTFLLEGRWRVA
jgi:hypothetical protein